MKSYCVDNAELMKKCEVRGRVWSEFKCTRECKKEGFEYKRGRCYRKIVVKTEIKAPVVPPVKV